jgi:uridine kinase
VALVARLVDAVAALRTGDGRVTVGIDGPDAAGKTTLAGRLASALPGSTRRLSVDDFLRPRAERYRRGALSPEGYYRDLFDLAAVVDACRADDAGHATLVVDGVFLLRPELRPLWTLSVYLAIPEQTSLQRALVRDVPVFGSAAEVERRYRERYLPGQALYRRDADPERHANVVVDNTDPESPVVLRWSVPA